MTKLYRGAHIFYRFFDRKTDVVNVFLHGWGCDHTSFLFCNKHLKQSALFLDFPPFGKSSKGIKDWTIFTYASMVISLLSDLKIKRFNLIGHSFGGRVAIILAVLCKDEIEKLVLVDSAGLKPHRSIFFYMKIWAYKIKRKLGLDISKYGSSDYLALGSDMRKIFKSIVNTHLDEFLPFIKAKTLVVFGENDKTTPLYMARKFKRKIKDSTLVILKNAGHFCFVDMRLEFLNLVKNFLE